MQALGDSVSALGVKAEDENEEEALEMLVEQVSEMGYGLVFFFDEFESITQNQNFDEQFFSRLRHIATTYNAAFVTSSREDLSRLCHTSAIAQSPFFNVFTKVDLQLLKEEEAISLICKPAEAQGIHFTDQEVKLVFELAGRHPFFIQIACSHLFELKRTRNHAIVSVTDFGQIREQFLAEAADHFDYCLRHLDDSERTALCAIATSSRSDAATSGMNSEVKALKRKGLVVQQDGYLRPFSFSLREFLQGLPPVSTVDVRQTTAVVDEVERLGNTDYDEGDYDGRVWHAILSLDKRLRLFLKQRFESKWGTNWEQQFEKHYVDMYQGCLERQQKDARAFPLYERQDVVLEYAYLGELGKLIEDDWIFFREVFEFKQGQGKANKQSLHQKVEEIVRVRNPLAHGRSVPDTELRRAHVSCNDLDKQLDMWGRRKGES